MSSFWKRKCQMICVSRASPITILLPRPRDGNIYIPQGKWMWWSQRRKQMQRGVVMDNWGSYLLEALFSKTALKAKKEFPAPQKSNQRPWMSRRWCWKLSDSNKIGIYPISWPKTLRLRRQPKTSTILAHWSTWLSQAQTRPPHYMLDFPKNYVCIELNMHRGKASKNTFTVRWMNEPIFIAL